MAEDQGASLGRQVRRAFAGLVIFDLLFAANMVFVWSAAGLADPLVALVLAVLRSAAWITLVYSQLRVALELGEPNAASDAQLLAADEALHRCAQRSALGFAVAWFIAELLLLLATIADVPVEVASGRPEHIAGLLFVVSAPGLAPVTELLADSALASARTEVGVALRHRKLQPDRQLQSFVRPIVKTTVWLLVGLTLALGGSAVVWNGKNARAQALALERARVEHSLTRLDAGLEPLAEVELLDAVPSEVEELHARAASELAPGDDASILEFHDHVRDLAIVVATRADGRVVHGARAPTYELGFLVTMILVLILVATPMFGFAFWLFARMMIRPVETFTAATREFVDAGEIGELERIIAARNDEIGQLALGLQQMFQILAELTQAATAVSDGTLSVELEHPGPLHDAFRGMLEHLNAVVGRLRETALELASAANEISQLSERQEHAALAEASNVQQLAQTVRSLADAAGQIADAAGDVRHDAEQAQATTNASAEQIATLRSHTASIGELLVRIAEIADRSDLLALNGSLEATRAGEAGRGFALVAAEMRRLAERTAGTVDDVRTRVADVESSSERSVAATERSRELAERTVSAARAIDELTKTQSRDTHQASQGVESTASMILATTDALAQIRAATEGLHAHAEALEALLAEFERRE